MANEMPDPNSYSGLKRKVLQYSVAFAEIVERLKAGAAPETVWAPFEELIDVEAFTREGVFAGAEAEVIGWDTYKSYISKYSGNTAWEGTLRHITEEPGRVILELEERNSHDGRTHVSNTVTIYEFNEAEKLRHLDVYVMPLRWQ